MILNTLKPVEHRHRLSHKYGIIWCELVTNTEKSIIKEKLSYPELMSSAPKLINEENDATDLENYCYDLICVAL